MYHRKSIKMTNLVTQKVQSLSYICGVKKYVRGNYSGAGVFRNLDYAPAPFGETLAHKVFGKRTQLVLHVRLDLPVSKAVTRLGGDGYHTQQHGLSSFSYIW